MVQCRVRLSGMPFFGDCARKKQWSFRLLILWANLLSYLGSTSTINWSWRTLFINAVRRRHERPKRCSNLKILFHVGNMCFCAIATCFRTLTSAHLAFISHPPTYCSNFMKCKCGFYIRSTYQKKPRFWNSTWHIFALDVTSPSLVASTVHQCAKTLLHFGDSFAALKQQKLPPHGKTTATVFESPNTQERTI